jgi:DNA primase
MSVTDEIKARLDIIELVGETVKLRRSGRTYVGFCPFHPNSRTPAFVVWPDSGTWRCFGQCNEGGDIFKYVMKKEGWDFAETLKYLAQRAGVVLEPPTPERQAAVEQNERLYTLLEEAVNFYRHNLLQSPAGQQALHYLEKRGLTSETLERFGLGYAPDAWDAALNYFTTRGYSPREMLEAGLATERQEGGGVYDRFRNRITFPIRDAAGRAVGFGARILNPNDQPKFLNSPQTALFDKGHLLYGLDQARKAIRMQDQVVIVEGYLDVIVLHQAGYTNTVSPMGTALTEDQLRLLKRFSNRIVLALDADAAGEKATLRGLDVARQTMDRSDEIRFDAHGLLRHEARLKADLRVTTLPPGCDPDEVVLKDPEEWGRILANAQPVVIHVMETLAKARNLDDPKEKSAVAAQILPLIEDVPDPIERDTYRQKLARLLKVDERTLINAPVSSSGRPQRRPLVRRGQASIPSPAEVIAKGPARLAYDLEVHCLRLLLCFPESYYQVDRALQKAGLSRLGSQDFEHTDHQLLLRLIQEALEQDQMEDKDFIRQNLPEALIELFTRLTAAAEISDPAQEKMIEDLIRSIFQLRRVRINEGLEQLRMLQQELQAQGERTTITYLELTVQYNQTRDRLDKALGQDIVLD